jgi:uncharacterized membrane protein YcaP (DUF421 family)
MRRTAARAGQRFRAAASEMRAQQIGSVEDVEWAILESNGTMSFIPK